MGVRGLDTFIKANDRNVLTPMRLHDTRVVIDGSNLLYTMYYKSKVSMQYGGDYNTYADKARKFFKALRSCSIQPYVVFDGGNAIDDRKLDTSIKRAEDRLVQVGLLSKGRVGRVLPILAFQTFLMVLNELGIPNVTCDFEADKEIASLATEWDCPVMSDDSDFYIFDIKKGFIPLDYLFHGLESLEIHTSDSSEGRYTYLNVQIYYVDNLLRLFKNLDRKLLPLFATLNGNDFVDPECFGSFFVYVNASLPNTESSEITILNTELPHKIVRLLMWLGSASNLESAVDEILSHNPNRRTRKVRLIITKSVEDYHDITSNVRSYFEDKGAHMHNLLKSAMRTHDGNKLPQWFIRAIRPSELSPQALNAILHHRVILRCQVEDLSKTSTYSCASVLRQLLYSILFTLDGDVAEGNKQTQGGKGNVEEYDRRQKVQIWNEIHQVKVLPSGEAVPRLLQILDLPLESRTRIMLDTLEATDSDIACVCRDLQLPLLVIRYWIKHAEPKVTKVHLKAILASFVKLSLVDVNISTKQKCKCTDPVSIHAFQSLCTAELLAKSKQRLSKFCDVPTHGNGTYFECSIIHAFAQFQACLHAAVALNQILLSPLTCPDPARLLYGTFMYRFCEKLRSCQTPLEYVQLSLGKSTPVADCFQALYNKVISSIDKIEDYFRQSETENKGRTMKRRSAKPLASVDGPQAKVANRFDGLGSDDE